MQKNQISMKGLFWGLLTIDMHFFADYFPEENTKTKVKKFDSYIGGHYISASWGQCSVGDCDWAKLFQVDDL